MTHIAGGWLNRHYVQLAIQLLDSVTGFAYSFGGSIIILFCIDMIGKVWAPMKLRVSEADELLGIDDCEIGEFAVCLNFPLIPRTYLADRIFSMTMSNSPVKSNRRKCMSAITASLTIPPISRKDSLEVPQSLNSYTNKASREVHSIRIHLGSLPDQVASKRLLNGHTRWLKW